MIAFDETKKIIPELVKQGIGPDKKKIYFVDGNLADYDKDFPKGTLTGVKGTLPGVVADDELQGPPADGGPEARPSSPTHPSPTTRRSSLPWPPRPPVTTAVRPSPRRCRR